mgnify:CR=1 FL=1
MEKNKNKIIMRNKNELLLLIFSLVMYCSQKYLPVKFDDKEFEKTFSKFWQTLSKVDIKNILSRPYLEPFFMEPEDLDMYIAKRAYEINQSDAVGGQVLKYSAISAEEDKNSYPKSTTAEKILRVNVYYVLRKKFPLSRAEIITEEWWGKFSNFWYVLPPVYIGDIKRKNVFEEKDKIFE